MIEYVSGILSSKKLTLAVVDVQGLGYRLFIPTSTFDRLPTVGKRVRLYTHQYVREDVLHLYGFLTLPERALFVLMIGISGVGPRLALAALSAMTPAEIQQAVLDGDGARLVTIPGVGRKTADRLVVELRDRVESLDVTASSTVSPSGAREGRADALAALEVLGLRKSVARRRIDKVLRAHPELDGADEIIRHALRES